ncbi:MAG: DUF4249 domain-containing protein [Bacteroidales bacterium]|nr:DUF4249 domain-containing protein [Bacteroidales bacterium]
MKTTLMKIITLLTILPFFMACKKYLDMDIIDKGRKPVVNALFIVDSVPSATVFQSTHILDPAESNNITNAKFIAIYNHQVFDTLYFSNTLNQYISYNHIIQSNEKIKIQVETNVGTVESEITTPTKIQFNSADTFPYYGNSSTRQGTEIKLSFNDPSATKDYYIIYTLMGNYINATGYNGNDPSIEELNNHLFIEDLTFNGKQKNISLIFYNNFDEYMSNTLCIYLMHVDEHYYKYAYSAYKQQNTGISPFSEPVMVYNNIKNGYGIFGTAAISVININF